MYSILNHVFGARTYTTSYTNYTQSKGANIVGYKTTTQGIKPIYGLRGPQ